MNIKHSRLYLAVALTLSAPAAFAFDLHGSLTDSTTLGQQASNLTGTTSGQAVKALRPGSAGPVANLSTDARGRNAGDGMGDLTPWGTVNYNRGDAETGFNAGAQELNIKAYTYQFGADRVIDGKYLVGVSVAYEDSEITNIFDDTQDSTGLSIMPYFGWVIDQTWLLDATVGYSDIDRDINANGGVPTSDSDDVDSDRLFAEVNINYFQPMQDNLEFSARAGLLYAEEDTEAHSSPDAVTLSPAQEVRLTQLKLGVQLAQLSAKFSPYIGVDYIRDLQIRHSPTPGYKRPVNGCDASPLCLDPEDDKDGLQLIAGFNSMISDGISLSFEAVRRVTRDSLQDTTVNLSLRLQF